MSQNILMQKQLFAVLTLCAAPLVACSGSDASTTDGSTTGAATTGDDGSATAQVTTPTTGTGESTESPTTAASATNPTTGEATTGAVTTGEESTGHVSRGDSTTEAPPVESCEDGLVNQDETDVDCGGAVCGPCADGLLCTADEDCVVASCILGTCAAPSCEDGLQNADETDADCGGGTCGACMDNLACVAAEDCLSGVCTEGVCTPPSCADGLKNGDETDLDCGGAICDGCLGELACNSGDDCLSETCTDGLCEQVDCLVDADCAALDTDCTSGSCKKPGYTCEAVAINDGQACAGADLCFTGPTCADGLCGGGAPVDCSGNSDQCHIGACDPGTGLCGATPLPDGTKCEDGVACTKLEVCKVGTCGGATDPLLVEPFANNNAGWTLDTEWAIGATLASAGCSGGQDPAADHTPTADNGVAGVVLGGCASTNIHAYYCLTSPVVDLSKAAADVHLSYWRWLHSDYTPYMKNKIEVYNGVTWVSVFETFAASTHDAAWTFFTYDVSLHKNDKFQARWCFNTASGVFSEASWSVDDVTIGANACVQ